MFSLFRPKAPKLATINHQTISVASNETILQAAIRENIEFPHSCRVGGCASCKCRLVEGEVKELTDIGYILSDAELDAGYILACQSVPKTHVTIEVELAGTQFKSVQGRIVEQSLITHNISQVVVQLEQSVNYKAGQYAQLSLDDAPQVSRSYSFATPKQPDGKVTFFIKHVPDGAFTSRLQGESLVDKKVTVQGPKGDFWLRSEEEKVLMIAGGSGLAPILAMLEDAIQKPNPPEVNLIFAARTQQDLYALDAINTLQLKWPTSFNFFPMLSDEPLDSDWTGDRGMVTALISVLNLENTSVYLCGPPIMIDSACDLLIEKGVDANAIYADRFIDQSYVIPTKKVHQK